MHGNGIIPERYLLETSLTNMGRTNKMKGKSITVIYFVLISILSLPKFCFASGDPMIVYSFVLFAFIHIVMGLYVVFAKRFIDLRFPVIIIYSINAFTTWSWAVNYRGPEFIGMYIGLIGYPLTTYLCLVWLSTILEHRKR